MNAYIAPLSLVGLGALVISLGAPLPSYTDPNWQHRFLDMDLSRVEDTHELTSQWYAAKAAVETPRHRLFDLGMGIAALGLAIALLFVFQRVRSIRGIGSLQSPSNRCGFLAMAAITWLSFVPAEWFWLGYTLERGDYPWWADSIGIPVYEVGVFGIVGLPVILLGAAVALRGTVLPVNLWSRPLVGRSYIVAAGLIIAGLLAFGVLVSGIIGAPFIVPSALFALYLLLSGRAAAAVRERRAELTALARNER